MLKLKLLIAAITVIGLTWFGISFATQSNCVPYSGSDCQAAEHPGKEHPGQEHPGKEHPGTTATVSAQDIRNGIDTYIKNDTELKGGYFMIYDQQDKKVRQMKLEQVHSRVANIKKEDAYFACCDFQELCDMCIAGQKHPAAHDKVDLDFWMKKEGDNFKPYRIVVHKINGKERHTYKDDEIAPVK